MAAGGRWASLLVSLLCVISCEASLTGDVRLLFALRESISRRRSALPSWFDSEISPCNWAGISCRDDHLVHGIDLSGMDLQLPIPASMGEFRNLKRLNLSNGGFFGRVPKTFANLLNLQSLDLSYNQFSGDLPPLIFHLRLLKELVLDSCGFSGELDPAVGRLSNLSRLSLSVNSFSGRLPNELGSLNSLEYLDLSANSFMGDLPSGLGNLTRLIHLDCSRNSFSGPIPSVIGNLGELLSLDLSSNQFSGPIPPEIGRLRSLESLWLGSNGLTGAIPAEIGNLSRLKILGVQGCSLSGNIPEEIGELRSLLGLDISENSFDGALPPSIGNLTDLIYLIAAHSGLTGELPEELGNCQSLRTLDLSFNSISGTLPEALSALTSIATFIVEGNRISGPIPPWMENWREVSSIRLSKNSFSGAPPPLKLPALEFFSADANLLSGEIPAEICRCNSLTLLSLSENSLSGGIAFTFKNCSSLTDLNLAGNQLSGELPAYLGDLPLVTLELSQNNFTGGLPSKLLSSPTLLELSLGGNNLSGEIPYSENSSLQRLQLDDNSFQGPIPASLGKLRNLTNLSVRRNRLSGAIPAELFDCARLVALDLGENLLSGPIPKAISKLKRLDNLVLSGNRLSGEIPGEVCGGFRQTAPPDSEFAQHYGVLDLSFNRLSGPIPAAIQNCAVVVELRLQSNDLTGGVPPELGRLANLTFLDLSSNRLTGRLTLPALGNLQGLLLSENRLSGSIPGSIAAAMPNLVKLNLSMNDLSGELPPAVFAIRTLTHLDISSNSISGPITLPDGISPETTSLLAFNASNNLLSGGLTLTGLSSLSVLDLHDNRLSGRVPSLASLPSLTFLDLTGNRLAAVRPGRGKRTLAAALAVALGGAAAVLAVGLVVVRRAGPADPAERSALSSASNSTAELLPGKAEPFSVNAPLRLSLGSVLAATENLSQVLGEGGFGTVYRAEIGAAAVAVKRLRGGGGGEREFMAEMETIGKVRHENLVPLLGYCAEGEERFLVYELMERGGLDRWVRSGAAALSWPVRLGVCLGAAEGLAFLHHGLAPRIIHRDIKSSNILLDRGFRARVADFGLARVIGACESHVSTDLAGSFGYVPPEYAQAMRATAEGDVYSFGVVVMEVLTGRAPIGQEEGEGGGSLVGWVRWAMARRRRGGVFDGALPGAGAAREQMRRVLALAVACTGDEPWRRPTMLEVVRRLKEIDSLLPRPDDPA
ncbi:uncharacterized protein LOC144705111 [Wolffia australiana]